MVVGGSQQETLNSGFVLLSTRQQGVPNTEYCMIKPPSSENKPPTKSYDFSYKCSRPFQNNPLPTQNFEFIVYFQCSCSSTKSLLDEGLPLVCYSCRVCPGPFDPSSQTVRNLSSSKWRTVSTMNNTFVELYETFFALGSKLDYRS
ncbi:unnamed protein product [Schistosoma margrebowiei]|uniref:Uncharacterized protein n=1 Tax=Schistosoma margrebowiei TaxID=48269 RepID=A0A183N705_9TREM|nr:unnamed protein product [Schistosoma margrebowiei]